MNTPRPFTPLDPSATRADLIVVIVLGLIWAAVMLADLVHA